jgi:hypothetical protein
VLGCGAAGWPVAGSLNLLARREGAWTTWFAAVFARRLYWRQFYRHYVPQYDSPHCLILSTSLLTKALCRSRRVAAGFHHVDNVRAFGRQIQYDQTPHGARLVVPGRVLRLVRS